MPTEGLKTLYGFVSNPNTKDMKIKAYESLLYGTFLDKNSLQITLSNVDSYAKKNGLKNPSQLILSQVIDKLSNQGILKKASNQTVILSKKDLLNVFEKQKTKNKEKMNIFYKFMISKLQNYFDELFTEEIVDGIKHLITNVIEEVMENYSNSVIDLYNGKFLSTYRENIDVIINKHINVIEHKNHDYTTDIGRFLLKVFKNQFLNPDLKFANALRLFALRHVMSKIILTNPSMNAVKMDFFKKARVFIDTNILIYLLCKSSRLYEITNNLVIETKKLGGEVLISDWTLNEFTHSIENAKYLYKKIREGKVKPYKVDSDIIDTYCGLPETDRNWFEFINDLNGNLKNFLNLGFIKLEECEEPDKKRLNKLESTLNKEFSRMKMDKKPSLITHDAKMILHIQESRDCTELTIGTCWFLTADERLRKIERINLTKNRFASESLISCDIWFEVLLPFIDTEYNEDDISKSFSKLLGINLIPISKDLVDSFVQHLSIQLELPDEDVSKLKSRIENVHIRNVLESAIIDDDYIGATSVLKELLVDSKKKEEYQKTIRVLSSRIRSFVDEGHMTFIVMEKFEELKKRVIHATTANEKGKTLEELASYLFDKINGLKIIDRNIRLESEEIDIILSNAAFSHWNDPIIVECKNWSKPISKTEVTDFIDKVKSLGATTGILVTIKGVTGDEYKDAMSKIAGALKFEKLHILVITWKDIEQIKSVDNWIDILSYRYYLPTKLKNN